MATGVGAAIGGISGPVGAVVGGFIGQVIDRQIQRSLTNRKTGPGAGPRNFRPNFAEEGGPIFYVFGRENRIPGTLILAGKPQSTGRPGASKRGAPEPETFVRDAIYQGASNLIDRTYRVLMDGASVYEQNPVRTMTNTFLGTRFVQQKFGPNETVQVWVNAGGSSWFLSQWFWTIENSPTGGVGGTPLDQPELSTFTPGIGIDVELQNNGVWVGQFVGAATIRNRYSSTNPLFQGGNALLVLESRVVGTWTGGGVTIPRRRLVMDLQTYINDINAQFDQAGQPGPFRQQSGPGPVPIQWYPFQVWPPSGTQTLEFQQGGTTFLANVANEGETYFYRGLNQAFADPNYVRRVGLENTPPLRQQTAVSFREINISRRGDRLPQVELFQAEADSLNPRTARYIFDRILGDFGGLVPQAHYSVAAADDTLEVLGMVMETPFIPMDYAGQLALATDHHIGEWSGRVHVVSRANRQRAPIDVAHCDSRVQGDPPNLPVITTQRPTSSIPKRLDIGFVDRDDSLQIGNTRVTRNEQLFSGSSDAAVDLGLTMSEFEAFVVGNRILADIESQSREGEIRLPYWYRDITPTDILQADGSRVLPGSKSAAAGTNFVGTEARYLIVQTVERDPTGRIVARGPWVDEDPPAAYGLGISSTQQLKSQLGRQQIGDSTSDGGVPEMPSAFAVILDIPALVDSHANKHGVYAAFCVPGGSAGGYQLQRNLTGAEQSWRSIGPATGRTVIARTLRGLPTAPVTGALDYTHALEVELIDGLAPDDAFSTREADDVLKGDGLLARRSPDGWELLRYQAAQEIEPGEGRPRFRLTGLVRGLRGTPTTSAVGDHEIIVAIPDEDALQFVELPLANVGTSVLFRILPGTRSSSTTEPVVEEFPQMLTSLSRPVTGLAASRVDGALLFTFTRGSRVDFQAGQTPPLLELVESYDVVIDPATTNRTIRVSSPQAAYTQAMQTQDGTASTEFEVSVYQNDPIRGRGVAATLRVGVLADLQWGDGATVTTGSSATLETGGV